jgi:DNA polymerase-3 subunit epsilon
LSGVHGIYPADTELSPTFVQVWPEIQSYFNGLVVAHNAPFDITKLIGTLEYYGLDLPKLNYFCTYELTGLRLPLACRAYGVELSQHHNAGSDALASLSIYYKHILGHKPILDGLEDTGGSGSFFSYKQVESDLLKPLSDAPDNYLKGKKVVFTGDLQSMSRNEAAKAAQSLGADVNTSISKHTRIVILGRGAGPKKLEKIEELRLNGFQIEILNEDQFMVLIQ